MLDSKTNIRVILEHYACYSYVVDYVNKADRGLSNLQKVVAEMLEECGDMGYPEVLKALVLNMLKAVKTSAQEAAWFLPCQDMPEKSPGVVYSPTCFHKKPSSSPQDQQGARTTSF